MFDHVKFGVSDYAASKAFFLQALAPLGVTLVGEGEPSYGAELAGSGDASLCLYQSAEKPAPLHCLSRRQPRAGRCLLAGGAGRRRKGQRCAGATAKLPRQLLRRVCDCARRAQY